MPLRALVPETSASANSATSAAACAPTPIFGYARHERNQHRAAASRVNPRSRWGLIRGRAHTPQWTRVMSHHRLQAMNESRKIRLTDYASCAG
jgi:hypothetical protein